MSGNWGYYRDEWAGAKDAAKKATAPLADGEYDALIARVQDDSENGKVIWHLNAVDSMGAHHRARKTSVVPKGLGFLMADLQTIFNDMPDSPVDMPRWLVAAEGATVRIRAKTTPAANGKEYQNIYFVKLIAGSGKPHPRELPPMSADEQAGFDQVDDDELPF